MPRRKSGGAVWSLSPLEQAMYIEDTKRGINLKHVNGTTFWDKEAAIRDRTWNPTIYDVRLPGHPY